MANWRFYADRLKSNSDKQRRGQPEGIPQAQNDFITAIQTLKQIYLLTTEQPSDLRQPFGRPNPGEGHSHDLTIDEIYVNVAIHEERANHYFAKDRQEQFKEYMLNANDCHFAKPEDIIDKEHANVLVVGRPGIGKTLLSSKLLRLWASGEAFNEDENYKVVFLVKFRRFNDGAKLSLRELLAGAETMKSLDDSVWEYVLNESTKVLLIFDGLDEYSRKEDIKAQEDDLTYKNSVEEKMPVSVLYNKLAEGKLLPGASILTTTRPTAVKCVLHVPFQRTVEIRGFTLDDIKEYVEKFARRYPGVREKMWGRIKSDINLFSLCYIPMNCFLICPCLLQIILCESSQLRTRMTDIFLMTIKMFLLNHMHYSGEGFSPKEIQMLRSTHMYEPFENFPEELQKIFNSLGKIAFKGIEKSRLIFESSEVSGLEDCGLLYELPDLNPKAFGDPPKSLFRFTHLTVQEFFAAKHLVDTKTDERIETFVCNHINDGIWQLVLQFVAGLLNRSSNIFIKLLPESTAKRTCYLSSEPKTLNSWPATEEDKCLAVQVCKCLYEINGEQQPVLQNKIQKIEFNAVEFSYGSLAPIDVAAVLHFLENAEEVLYIDLSLNNFGDLGANEVKKFIVNRERKLKRLELSDNNFTDNAAKDFAAALKHSNCKLESLFLLDNFTDNAAKDFAAALTHSNCKLESLFLLGNNLTDNAAKDFAAALEHSNYCKLESLVLFGNFTDNAAKDFAAALKHSNCKLESLHLSGKYFTDNAAKDFAAALKHSNCKLRRLFLYCDNFTEVGRQYLTDAGKQSNCHVMCGNDQISRVLNPF